MTVVITVVDNGAFKFIDNLPIKAKKISKKEMWAFTRFGAMALKDSAKNAGIGNYTGRLLSKSGIEARKLGEGKYGILIPDYGIALDSMEPHYVALKKGRKITAWAKKNYDGSRIVSAKSLVFKGPKGGILYEKGKRSAVYVTKHPYINAGFNRMVNRLSIVANRIGNKIIRG